MSIRIFNRDGFESQNPKEVQERRRKSDIFGAVIAGMILGAIIITIIMILT